MLKLILAHVNYIFNNFNLNTTLVKVNQFGFYIKRYGQEYLNTTLVKVNLGTKFSITVLITFKYNSC